MKVIYLEVIFYVNRHGLHKLLHLYPPCHLCP